MKPRRSIRRFDVFAEYRKQEEQEKGTPLDEAKGYGIWVAKVVASRAYGRGTSIGLSRGGQGGDKDHSRQHLKGGKWHLLGDEAQDDKRFDAEIVRRMGEDFYREVFEPAIREAREAGETYESIRDAIRREWKPEPVKPARAIRATRDDEKPAKTTKTTKTAKKAA